MRAGQTAQKGGRCHERHQSRDHHRRQTRQRRASRGGAVRAVSFGQDVACSRASSTPRGPSAGAVRRAQAPSIGDGAAEARKRGMGTELNIASVDYLGDQWSFLDVPGSIEFQHDAFAALAVCDAAVVVCEPSPERVVALTPLLEIHRRPSHPPRHLHQQDRFRRGPRARHAGGRCRPSSSRKLVLRQVPIRRADRRRRRGDGGLCRPRERARLSLQVERRLRPDRDAGRDPAAREPRRGARCSRRCRSSTTRCSSS